MLVFNGDIRNPMGGVSYGFIFQLHKTCHSSQLGHLHVSLQQLNACRTSVIHWETTNVYNAFMLSSARKV